MPPSWARKSLRCTGVPIREEEETQSREGRRKREILYLPFQTGENLRGQKAQESNASGFD
jgi:hypothetical protein